MADLSTRIKARIKTFATVFPLPQGVPGDAHEDRCRAWCQKLAEQLTFDDPGAHYGLKKASPTRPISKDSLAQQLPALHSWDLMTGAGTGKPKLAKNPQYHDIPDQVFVPVKAVDHLGGSQLPEPEPGPTPGPTPPPAPQPPLVSHAEQLRAGREIAAILSDDDSVLHDNLIAMGEVIAHLCYKFRERPHTYTVQMALDNATRRAQGLPAD